MHKDFPEKTIRRVSNIHPIRRATPAFIERRDILFVGNFRHPPNHDGLQWFLETAWPLIHAKRPDIALNVVGASAPESLIRMSEHMNVCFQDHVPDIEKYIDKMRINIAPLRYGAGAKGKISQALASGLPTIATTVASDGMRLSDNESTLLADDTEAFANAVLALYEDESLWNKLSKNGYDIAATFYSELAVAQEIKSMLA